jgi:hypothetical protein
MTKRSWLRNLFSRPVVRPVRKAPYRDRPALEVLEGRWVPSTFTVNSTGDTGTGAGLFGDLRYCVNQTNGAGGDQTITFDPTVFATPQTITLSGTQLELKDTTGTETITGPAAGVTVSGGGLSRVFQVDTGVTASFSGLTITGGKTTGNGGGLRNVGTATLSDCTISGNSASSGGGLVLNSPNGTTTLTNCTLSGNSASGVGGALFNNGSSRTTLTNCTVSGNSAGGNGGGLDNNGAATLTLTNTIVAVNTGGDLVGSLTAASTNNLIDGNALLAPLGDYGGPTQTMALLPGSPAIDAGISGAGIPSIDQRGESRVGAVDIGAFESQGFTFSPIAGSTPQTSPIGAPFANPLAVTVTANHSIEPVNGGAINFVANRVNGATAILSGSSVVISGGQASVMAEPNNAVGTYTVVASTTGASSFSFALTNLGPVIASLVVNSTSDSLFPGAGLLSLREAIAFANLDSMGISAITFDKNVFATPQTILLNGNQLELSNTSEMETITGPAAGVTISGGGNSQVFQVDGLVTASITGLTISGGNTASNGGGLNNLGTATMTNCNFTGNTASSGGGLNNLGTATMTNCNFTGNTASNGGGLNNLGTATMTNCNLTGNTASGGAVTTDSRFGHGTAQTTLTNCTVSGNTGTGVVNFGTTTLNKCTVSGNSGNGVTTRPAIFSSLGGVPGVSTLTGCTVSGNTGAGVFTGGLAVRIFDRDGVHSFIEHATSNLTNCTVSDNTASGFATRGGMAAATHTTISGNEASGDTTSSDGGGVFTDGFVSFLGNVNGTTTLTDCTVSGNTAGRDGGGVSTSALGTTTATNTAITGNTAGRDGGGFSNSTLGSTTLTKSMVGSNTATGNGGGISNQGTFTANHSLVERNSANVGGGISNQGTLNVASSIITANRAASAGGGISTTGGSATITDSLINGNFIYAPGGTALGGGIDCENSVLSLTNCSVSVNQAYAATVLGGGIYALNSTVNIDHSRVLGNIANGTVLGEGGGIYSFNSVLTLANSLVAGNKATTAFDDIFIGP